MKYRLVVLTDGEGEHLEKVLNSFYACVEPYPAEMIVVRDGPGIEDLIERKDRWPRLWSAEGKLGITCTGHPRQAGFCAATKLAWFQGARPTPVQVGTTPPFVFYLEHDFVFTREVDLAPLASVLMAKDYEQEHPMVAQVSLMRQPCNQAEEAAGGVVQSFPEGTFEPAQYACAVASGKGGLLEERLMPYLEHTAYFTTNPSLMRTRFMEQNMWPDQYGKECEGKFGLDLVARGYRFAIWGDGEPWVEHIGTRNGHGY